MTRKDYIAFAAALKAAKPNDPRDIARRYIAQWQHDCRAVASVLAADNPRFSHDKFLTACGFPS